MSLGESDDGGEGFGPDEYSALLFNPRAGYALMFNETIGFWPQGGFSYYSTSRPEVFSESGFDFAIFAGPYVDIGLTGSYEDETPMPAPDHDRKYRSIGLQVGLLGWL
jgi:hypothetical protein